MGERSMNYACFFFQLFDLAATVPLGQFLLSAFVSADLVDRPAMFWVGCQPLIRQPPVEFLADDQPFLLGLFEGVGVTEIGQTLKDLLQLSIGAQTVPVIGTSNSTS
jgi:hypothetical protein